jgi:cysteine desulfuration protein SufE
MRSQNYSITDLEQYLNQKQIEFVRYRKQGLDIVNKKLIELGNTLGDFPEIWKIKANKVAGCTSNVYIHANFVNGKVYFGGSSESEIVRGQVALLINGLNQLTPEQIVHETEKYLNNFVKNTDVRFSMTVTRTNSLGTLYLFMKKKAQDFLNF